MTHELPISSRAAAIKPSATLSVSARANELRAEGKQVLNFAAGEPDFRPPDVIRICPSPLYGTFHEIWRTVQQLQSIIDEEIG